MVVGYAYMYIYIVSSVVFVDFLIKSLFKKKHSKYSNYPWLSKLSRLSPRLPKPKDFMTLKIPNSQDS